MRIGAPALHARGSVTAVIAVAGLLLLAGAVASGRRSANGSEPIRLDPANPHYFLFRGKTIALITSGEHYGAVLNADFDYHRYLATLEADGFNYTRLFGGSYVEVPAKSFGILRNDLAPAPGRFVAPWSRSDTPGYAGGGNKFDLARWNPEYFARLHDFLAEAEQRGVVVEITLFSSQYGEAQWAVSPFNRSNNINGTDTIDWRKVNTLENANILARQEAYARKLVLEAKGFSNVIFEIANEPWSDRPVLSGVVNPYLQEPERDRYPNSIDLPDEATLEWEKRVAEWITSEEATLPNRHLIAQNYCNFKYPVRRLIDGVGVVNFHYAYPAAVALNFGLGKAISYDETGFLGRNDDAYVRQAWNFMLSGGSVFDNLDYSFSVGHEDGDDAEPNGPGGGSAELRRRLRVLADFLKALPLREITPHVATVTHAGGVVAHALSNGRGDYAIYFDGSGPGETTLNLPAGEYTEAWTDIESGGTAMTTFHHAGGEKELSLPEFKTGVALRLTRAKR
ncbi:MAG TPA: hypothetical protein VMH00_07190 [Candidatus Limnocylindrales bacterium]|nr:hypothetical protein [Candidatus Limnocylindrales bacterium]